jgi:hypothetical protein
LVAATATFVVTNTLSADNAILNLLAMIIPIGTT